MNEMPNAPDAEVALDPMAQANLRRECLQWAVSTAKDGDEALATIARAEAYFRFIVAPLRRDVIAVQHDQLLANQARSSGQLN